MINKLYILAHTWRDTDMTVETFNCPFEASKYLSGLIGEDYGKDASESDHISDYLEGFYEYQELNEMFICHDWVVKLEIVDLDSMIKKKKYNHAVTVAFEVQSDNEVMPTMYECLEGLTRRLHSIKNDKSSTIEVFESYDCSKNN